MARTVWSKNQEHEEEGDFGEEWMRRGVFFLKKGGGRGTVKQTKVEMMVNNYSKEIEEVKNGEGNI